MWVLCACGSPAQALSEAMSGRLDAVLGTLAERDNMINVLTAKLERTICDIAAQVGGVGVCLASTLLVAREV